MNKCPNCGSTAQVKKIGCSDTREHFIERFECGCGCQFDAIYYWCGNMIYMTDVKMVDKSLNPCYNNTKR